MLVLSGLVHQIISGDAAETAPTETTTARGLFEQTWGVARSTTSDHLVVLEGLRTTDTPKLGNPVSVVTVMLGYSKTPVTHSTRYLRTNGFQGYCYVRNNKPTSQREVFPLLVKEKTSPRHKLK
jgi:hypothetical protein